MAQTSGRKGVFKAAGSAVAEMRNFSITETANVDDGSQMGDDWDRSNVISMAWSGSASFREDNGNSSQNLLAPGDEVAIEAYTTGETSGNRKLSGNVLITDRTYPSDLSASVENQCNFLGQGALTKETLP